jgi:rod shape-determining protein MreD
MRHWVLMAILLVMALVLQATVFTFLTVAGVKPDLLLIIIVLYGLLYGKAAAGLGFAYGLVEDLLLGRFIGFNAITKAIMGFLVGYLEPKLFKDHILVPIVVLLLGTLAYGVIGYALGLLVGVFTVFEIEVYTRTVILQAIYNAGLAPFFYGRYYKLSMQRFVKKLRR